MALWTPGALVCRVCSARFPVHRPEQFGQHIDRCVEKHQDYVDSLRVADAFEGDPELSLFAREEGDVYNRRAGTRRKPR